MFFHQLDSSLTKAELVEKANSNLRWFKLIRATDKPVYPRISGHMYGYFFTVTVVIGYMNSFKPVFYGRFAEKNGKGQIKGFFAWPLASIGLFLGVLAFLSFQTSIREAAGIFVALMILSMFTLVWLFCKFMARTQEAQIKDYLTWLSTVKGDASNERSENKAD